MIVKMKKITILVSEKQTNEALRVLRKLGIVHVKHTREPIADHITSLEHKILRVDKLLSVINVLSSEAKDVDKDQILNVMKDISVLEHKRQDIVNRLRELEKELLWFKEWGNVCLSDLGELKKKGVFIKLYKCDKNFLKNIAKDKLVYVVNRQGSQLGIAFVSSRQEELLDFSEVKVPNEGQHLLEKKRALFFEDLECVDKKIREFSVYRNFFIQYRKALLKELEFCRVRFGMAHKEGIRYLEGFCPNESIPEISKAAVREGWGVITQEPDISENVPTLIRNPKWLRIIQPVFKFIGTLPGYKEYDISLWFLLFFSIFFAMLIGDAGYGLIFFAVTLWGQRKFKNVPGEPFFLMYVLSCATILWGAITGTWFGFEKFAQLPILNNLVINKLNSFESSNQMFLIHLCFLIGAIHLTIAHGIVAYRYINSIAALAQIGWICIVWAVFFVAGTLVLNKPFPDFALILGIVGVILVVLFFNPRKNILAGMAITLADLPLKIISSFSDIVSYLRLFAVGYASVVVAATANSMALGSGVNSFWGGLAAALILFVGHAINIILGFIAVIVHGVRLNMLEFSGHMDMQWSGREYNPFKEYDIIEEK